MSAEEPTTELFVNGTLMQGLALHANLGDATFLGETRTAPSYRLHSIDDVHPGMYWAADGSSIAGELYAVTAQQRDYILATEPPGLYFGPVKLADGRTTEGVLFSAVEASRYPDITGFGGWRAYQAAIHRRTTA